MKLNYYKLADKHSGHLKKVYGDGIFLDKNFFMNYGWCSDDDSITTKIYQKSGSEYLTTYYNRGQYLFDSGKL